MRRILFFATLLFYSTVQAVISESSLLRIEWKYDEATKKTSFYIDRKFVGDGIAGAAALVKSIQEDSAYYDKFIIVISSPLDDKLSKSPEYMSFMHLLSTRPHVKIKRAKINPETSVVPLVVDGSFDIYSVNHEYLGNISDLSSILEYYKNTTILLLTPFSFGNLDMRVSNRFDDALKKYSEGINLQIINMDKEGSTDLRLRSFDPGPVIHFKGDQNTEYLDIGISKARFVDEKLSFIVWIKNRGNKEILVYFSDINLSLMPTEKSSEPQAPDAFGPPIRFKPFLYADDNKKMSEDTVRLRKGEACKKKIFISIPEAWKGKDIAFILSYVKGRYSLRLTFDGQLMCFKELNPPK